MARFSAAGMGKMENLEIINSKMNFSPWKINS
jgi:hypothetical protein